uniref:Uncharacterized protein n=1 Tax=Falco tinnunculus TaxID=100819 RepID=A0A8C4U7Y2_FALTI
PPWYEGNAPHLRSGEVWLLGPVTPSCPRAPLLLRLSALGRAALAFLFLPFPHRLGVVFNTGVSVFFQQGAALGPAAAALDKRETFEPLDPSRGGGEFYQVQDSDLYLKQYCRKCPAGTYVAQHCKEQNGSSKCLPCKEGEYTQYPNDFLSCLGCQRCREDQVELSPCHAVRNTQCACKSGTFCSPFQPCELCQKCRSRCPKDEVEQAPCTPHSDRQCGPPTDTLSSSSVNLIVIFVVITVVTLVLCMCCCCCPQGHGRQLSRKSCNIVDYLMRQLTSYQRRGPGTHDNHHNEQIFQDQLLSTVSVSAAPSAVRPEVMVPRTSCPIVKSRRNLVPVQGEDPVNLLQGALEVFAEDVPPKQWKKFCRALDLPENTITLMEMNKEEFFQMLRTWQNRQGANASVNTLLEALHRISLGGVAEDISSKLVQQGSYQYEVS